MITQEMNLDIESNPFWSPFELVRLVANLEVKKINLGDHNPDFANQLSESDKALYKNSAV